MFGGTVIIDDAGAGGSADGAWLTHIAHTPALRSQCPAQFPAQAASGRTETARAFGGDPLFAPVPPATPWEAMR